LTNIIQKKFDIYNFFKIKFTFLEALIILKFYSLNLSCLQ
jgi:hypothetical protein